jgi:hypothetical protein
MAFDPDNHVHDPRTGMLRHAETGHLIGIETPPHKNLDVTEWPAWVEPHDSHVERRDDVVAVPGWEWHVTRDGRVTVLCLDAEVAARAQAPKGAHEPSDPGAHESADPAKAGAGNPEVW